MKAAHLGMMMGPPRLLVAVRALAWLATRDGVSPSTAIAAGLHAHPSFLRRLMSPLVKAGIVEVREGRDGGYALARPAERITLGDVYRALGVQHEGPFGRRGHRRCTAADALDAELAAILGEGEMQFVASLEPHTIADLIHRSNGGP